MTSPVRSPPIPCWNFVLLRRERCNVFISLSSQFGILQIFHINHSIKSWCFLVTFEKCLSKTSPAQSEKPNVVQWLNRALWISYGVLRSAKFIKVATVVTQPCIRQTPFVVNKTFSHQPFYRKLMWSYCLQEYLINSVRGAQMFVQWLTHALWNSYGVIRSPKFLKVSHGGETAIC